MYFVWMAVVLQQTVPDVPILRVNQIDAARLDVEMTGMLKEQLSRVFSLSQVCSFLGMLNYAFPYCWLPYSASD